MTGLQRRQVTEAQVPPPPKVTEYLMQAKQCGRCGVTTVGKPPAHVSGRAQFGPETHALAANLLVGHHVLAKRSTSLATLDVRLGADTAERVTREDDPANRRR